MAKPTNIPVEFIFGHGVTSSRPQPKEGQFVFDLDTGCIFIDLKIDTVLTRTPVRDDLAVHLDTENILTGSIKVVGADGHTETAISGAGLETTGFIKMSAIATIDHEPDSIAVFDRGELKRCDISSLYTALKIDELEITARTDDENLILGLNNKEIWFNG